MDSESIEEDSGLISRNELYLIRKEKLRKEIEAARRILESNEDPLRIADKFMHGVIELLKDGISSRYPELTREEIQLKMRESFNLVERIKANRKRKKVF